MANLYETLADAQQGEAMAELGREFGLTTQQTQAAVAALLPAILGLKRSTATPEGLGNLLALMGARRDRSAMYDDRRLLSRGRDGKQAMQSYPGCLARLTRAARSPIKRNNCPASVQPY